jgi:hypothetical protein
MTFEGFVAGVFNVTNLHVVGRAAVPWNGKILGFQTIAIWGGVVNTRDKRSKGNQRLVLGC